MTREKLNIAIAGTGFGLKVHLPALNESDKFIANSFFHHNVKKCESIEEKTGLKCFSNWNELITNKNIDGIIIATPPHTRFDFARKALENNKHLLLEKPVALNSKEIEELQRISLLKNLKVCVDFEYRAVPLFLQAKEIIEKNSLGEIYFIKLDWIMSSRSDPLREWNWYSQSNKGGGVLGALGTHAFDLLHWLFGDSIRVSGNTYTSIKERPVGQEMFEVDSDDICLANIEIGNNQGKVVPCQVSLSSISRNGTGFSLEVYGKDGSLFLVSDNQKDYVHGFRLTYSNNENIIKTIQPIDKFAFKKTWTDGRIAPVQRIQNLWGECILNNTPIIPGLSEGVKSQKVCDAIKESSDSGFTIEIK
tara:strand:- start:71 stop:1159 length:1089 start_codon:yes stop_codon:yes gene_type:complete